MITGNRNVVDDMIDLSIIDISFSSKPLVFGGLAMAYYGLRKGNDIDLLVTDHDYHLLVEKYPCNKKDVWGDLGLVVDQYDFMRSIFRLDYDFYSEGAIEYTRYKIVSFEKLFFMKALAFHNRPEIQKHIDDFNLVMNCYIETYKNVDYHKNALKHTEKYLSVPDGIVLNDNY